MRTGFEKRNENLSFDLEGEKSPGFSREQIEKIFEKADHECQACGKDEENDTSALGAYHIVPLRKGGKNEIDNAVVLCRDCHQSVEELKRNPPQKKERLAKSTKKKLWKVKGRCCQSCGLETVTGGVNIAIHPFRPAGWSGEVGDLKVLCPSCLGQEARKRDKLLELAREDG